MSSTAFSAQGSTISVGTGTGAAMNITAIAPGNPTIITIDSHGRGNGDVVTIAGVVGTIAAALNGESFTASNVTANTFALPLLDTTGLAYTDGGTATPQVWTQIVNVKSYSGFDGTTAVVDVTDLSSISKEKRAGLQDAGAITLDFHTDYNDPGQNAVRAFRAASQTTPYKLSYPNGKVASWLAFPVSVNESGAVNSAVAGQMKLEITGPVVVA